MLRYSLWRGWLHASLLVVLLVGVVMLGAGLAWAGPPAQDRTSLQYGQAASGVIDDQNVFQQYSFAGTTGDAVVITMDATSGDLDPLLLLGDEDLNLIAEDDDGGSGFNARLEIVLPADGVYVIQATRYQQETGTSSGEYRLTLTADQTGGSGGLRRGGVLSALAFGDTERGTLNADDRFHLFWFQAQAGDQVAVQSALGVGVSAALVLYDDGFNELARDPNGLLLSADISADGIYFATLALTSADAGGTYALTLTGSGDAGAGSGTPPTPLTYGQRAEGQITDQRPAERYTFQGRASDQVLLRMEALGDGLDPFLYLYGPDGAIIGQDDDSGGGLDAELTAVLPAEGDYTIVATRFGQANGTSSGGYALSLNQRSALAVPSEGASAESDEMITGQDTALPEPFVGLPQLRYGDVIGGTLGDETYFQAFAFRGNAGDEIVITMEQASGDLDPFIQLLDASVETLAQNDDIDAANTNSRLEYAIPATGYYAIFATRYQGEQGTTSGDFVLTLNAATALGGGNVAELLATMPLASGEPGEGQIAGTIVALYSFYASAGDTVELTLTAGDPLGSEAILILADAALNEIGISFAGSLRYTVAQDGLYVVIVSRQGGPFGDARGFYELELSGATGSLPTPTESQTGDAPPGSVLRYGDVVTGEINSARPSIEYTFEGQMGDRIAVGMVWVDATLDPLVILLGPERTEVARDDDSAGDLNALIESYLLTATGEYTIIATRYEEAQGASRGRFELTLTGIPAAQPIQTESGALLLQPGQIASGAISDEASATFYVFPAQAGVTVEIAMTSMSGDLDPFLALLDANQTLIAQDDDSGPERNALLIYTIPADGQYFIMATRYQFLDGDTAGEYLLSLDSR